MKRIPCDKPIAGGILEQLVDSKINHIFNALGDAPMARRHWIYKHWWLRGLKKVRKIFGDENESAVAKFKRKRTKTRKRDSAQLLKAAQNQAKMKVLKKVLS